MKESKGMAKRPSYIPLHHCNQIILILFVYSQLHKSAAFFANLKPYKKNAPRAVFFQILLFTIEFPLQLSINAQVQVPIKVNPSVHNTSKEFYSIHVSVPYQNFTNYLSSDCPLSNILPSSTNLLIVIFHLFFFTPEIDLYNFASRFLS